MRLFDFRPSRRAVRAVHRRARARFALLLVAAACARSDAAPADSAVRAIPVDLASVQLQSLAPPVIATGTLGGKEEVALSFTIGGVVARILVDEGAAVRRGQLLAELTPVTINSEVAKAEQGRLKAERDLARVRRLHADSVATTEQLQDATTGLDMAEQNLRIARFNLEHAVVRAPADGVVLRRMAEPNQVVSPGTSILLVRSAQRGTVLRAGLPDRDAVRVRVGDEADVTFDALPGEPYRGRVSQVASAASAGSGTYGVEVTLDARAASLASGLIGHVEIHTRSQGSYPVVPLEALVEADGDSAELFVVATGADRGTRRRVHIARILGDRVALSSGATPGERVVVRGAAYLDEGARISIRHDAAASASSAASGPPRARAKVVP